MTREQLIIDHFVRCHDLLSPAYVRLEGDTITILATGSQYRVGPAGVENPETCHAGPASYELVHKAEGHDRYFAGLASRMALWAK